MTTKRELEQHLESLQNRYAQVTAENTRLADALEESLALNENFVSVSEPETLAHLSEYRAVIADAKAVLKDC